MQAWKLQKPKSKFLMFSWLN